MFCLSTHKVQIIGLCTLRYNKTEKSKVSRAKYEKSEKGKATAARKSKGLASKRWHANDYLTHRKERMEKSRRNHRKNRERILARKRDYCEENPELRRAGKEREKLRGTNKGIHSFWDAQLREEVIENPPAYI